MSTRLLILPTDIGATLPFEQVVPYVTRTFPGSGEMAYLLDRPMLFYVSDDGAGIDVKSFWAKIAGTKYSYGDIEVELVYSAPDRSSCIFSVVPTGLKWNQEIEIEVLCEDRLGNPGLNVEIS